MLTENEILDIQLRNKGNADVEAPMSDWPKHPDGRNKKVGEMNQDERRVVFAAAAHRVKREFEQPHFQSAMQKILEASDPDLD